MRPRWKVVARVKRYPFASPDDVARLSTVLLMEPFELGEVIGEVSGHRTKWGAERAALRTNLPPSLTWRAVAERAQ